MSVRLVFVHSPLLGPESWAPLAREMPALGWSTAVPKLQDAGHGPYWRQHVESVVTGLHGDDELVLFAHSGAGALLAAIADQLRGRVRALLFVDAGLPEEGRTRLEMLRAETGDAFADGFERHLKAGGRYPDWSDADLAGSIDDSVLRAAVLESQRRRPLDFWTERIPAPTNWASLPCAYLRLSDGYAIPAKRAREMGWPVLERAANHFAILTEPALVAADLEALLGPMGFEGAR